MVVRKKAGAARAERGARLQQPRRLAVAVAAAASAAILGVAAAATDAWAQGAGSIGTTHRRRRWLQQATPTPRWLLQTTCQGKVHALMALRGSVGLPLPPAGEVSAGGAPTSGGGDGSGCGRGSLPSTAAAARRGRPQSTLPLPLSHAVAAATAVAIAAASVAAAAATAVATTAAARAVATTAPSAVLPKRRPARIRQREGGAAVWPLAASLLAGYMWRGVAEGC